MTNTEVVKLTQILIDEGWKFIDNGTSFISGAINSKTNEKINFQQEKDFTSWMENKQIELL